jgi:ABC-type Fe3+/spermidine/putrescine transport system ATPase subunit
MFLNIKNLSKKYGENSVLSDLNFSLNKGEIISIIGSSGSGKTTLLKCISGLCDIDNGEISIDLNQIQNLEPNKRNIGYVFQESPLFPHLNVIDNILFNMKDIDSEKLNFLLEKIQIKQLKNRYPHEISGGENQRVSVARSLIRNPSLLLLDEPFNNLDNQIKKDTKELIFDTIKKTETTTIIVNHDIQESLEISDKILVLDKDIKNNMIGTPLEVYSEPISLETARLFGEINSINLNDKKIYCRPHNISIVDKSNIKVTVIESKFLGPCYKIIAKFKTDKIILFNNEEIKKSTIIYLNIKQKNKLKFD